MLRQVRWNYIVLQKKLDRHHGGIKVEFERKKFTIRCTMENVLYNKTANIYCKLCYRSKFHPEKETWSKYCKRKRHRKHNRIQLQLLAIQFGRLTNRMIRPLSKLVSQTVSYCYHLVHSRLYYLYTLQSFKQSTNKCI